MVLCRAQSLVNTGGRFVIHDQITKYADWYQDGYVSASGKCFDIGNGTRQSLTIRVESTRKPLLKCIGTQIIPGHCRQSTDA